jgi:hypothetical protein
MTDMPKIHPREENVQVAQLALREILTQIRKDLTFWEFMRIISSELAGEWSSMAKYGIREERHPENPDQPGGFE